MNIGRWTVIKIFIFVIIFFGGLRFYLYYRRNTQTLIKAEEDAAREYQRKERENRIRVYEEYKKNKQDSFIDPADAHRGHF